MAGERGDGGAGSAGVGLAGVPQAVLSEVLHPGTMAAAGTFVFGM